MKNLQCRRQDFWQLHCIRYYCSLDCDMGYGKVMCVDTHSTDLKL